MKILLIVPYPPSLIRVRSYNLLRQLVAHGHEVTLFTLWENSADLAQLAHLKQFCHVEALPLHRHMTLRNLIRALPTRKPLQFVYCWQPAAKAVLAKLAQQSFDVVHVEHLRGAIFGLAWQQLSDVPVLWDSVDSISYLFEQAARENVRTFGRLTARIELPRTRHYEKLLLSRFQHTVVTSEIDRKALLALNPKASITVLSNGVDLDYFSPNDKTQCANSTILFSGKMSYHANVTMAYYLIKDVMPAVWQERTDAILQIVGKNPSKPLVNMGKQEQISITGGVPDMRPYLQGATLAAVPLIYGAGTQFKLLEAMACGTPVVVTPRAIQSLAVTAECEVLVGRDSAEFAAHILSLLDTPQRRNQLGANGRRYVEKHHNWKNITAQLLTTYQHLQAGSQHALSVQRSPTDDNEATI